MAKGRREYDSDSCSSPVEILDCVDGDQCDNEETGEVTDHLIVAKLAPGAIFIGISLRNPPPSSCHAMLYRNIKSPSTVGQEIPFQIAHMKSILQS